MLLEQIVLFFKAFIRDFDYNMYFICQLVSYNYSLHISNNNWPTYISYTVGQS